MEPREKYEIPLSENEQLMAFLQNEERRLRQIITEEIERAFKDRPPFESVHLHLHLDGFQSHSPDSSSGAEQFFHALESTLARRILFRFADEAKTLLGRSSLTEREV